MEPINIDLFDRHFEKTKISLKHECDECNFININAILNNIFMFDLFYLDMKYQRDLFIIIINSIFDRIKSGGFTAVNIINILNTEYNENINKDNFIKFYKIQTKSIINTYINKMIKIIYLIYHKNMKKHIDKNNKYINKNTKEEIFKSILYSLYLDFNYLFIFDKEKNYLVFRNYNKKLSLKIFKISKKMYKKLFLIVPFCDRITLTPTGFISVYIIYQYRKVYNKSMIYFNIHNFTYYINKFKNKLLTLMLCSYIETTLIYKLPWEILQLLFDNILSITYDYKYKYFYLLD